MSDLFTSGYSNRCQGWTNPNNIVFGPKITSLSSYYSPAGSTSLITLIGENFYSYSTISFGTYKPTVYFVSSITLQFYVPSTLNAGTYPIQVFNGSFPSNIINYNIDNASGYWLLGANGSIQNTNNGGLVAVNSLSRGIPVQVTEQSGIYTVPNNVNWIICYNESTPSPITINLPVGSSNIGREIMIKSLINSDNPSLYSPLIISSSNNIVPLNGTNFSYGTNIIIEAPDTSLGEWVTLVYNGTFWIVMQGGFIIS
jgi:hypothetical protein